MKVPWYKKRYWKIGLSSLNDFLYQPQEPNSSSMVEVQKRYAVVTGANKGIGLEICKQLASKGVTVILTARDEKKGLEAVKNFENSGLSNVVFYQLDVADPASILPLADRKSVV